MPYRQKSKNPFRKHNTKKIVADKKQRALVSLIKSVTLKQAERKYHTGSLGSLGQCYHDNIYDIQMWQSGMEIFPSQGTSDASRIGDRIILQGLMLRCSMTIPSNTRGVVVKMWFVPYEPSVGNPSTYGDFFHNITGSLMLDPVQKKRFPYARYLGQYRVKPTPLQQTNSEVNGNAASIHINKYIKMNNKKLLFKADASNIPTNYPSYGKIVLGFYETTDSSVLTPVCSSVEMSITTYFKDL